MAAFITGNSGSRTTGDHLDFRVWDVNAGGFVDPRRFTNRMRVGDSLLTDRYDVTSGYGMREDPINGGQRMHDGIDYGTPSGTAVTIDGGNLLTTFNDPSGGVTSQFSITGDDGNPYEILLMHGSEDNQILSDAAVTDGRSLFNNSPSGALPTATPAAQTVDVMDYDQMSASELNNQYDRLRMAGDALKATNEGLAMHRAYFGKK
jgi:hypothetical protein